MAVPGHDARDWEFAKNLIFQLLKLAGGDVPKEPFTENQNGTMVNSDILNGLTVEEAKKRLQHT